MSKIFSTNTDKGPGAKRLIDAPLIHQRKYSILSCIKKVHEYWIQLIDVLYIAKCEVLFNINIQRPRSDLSATQSTKVPEPKTTIYAPPPLLHP